MDTTETSKKSLLSNLTFQILIAVVLGAVLGVFVFKNLDETFRESFSKNIKLLATTFIRLVQMIIAPLVFTTLVVGIAKLGDIKSVGRIGGRALGWFFTASFISLLIGMFWVNVLEPGKKIQLPDLDADKATEIVQKTEGFSAQNFVEHIIPKSVVEAMATNEILQIVIFSIFFGLAAASIGSHAKPVINALDKTSHIILKMVNYVMKFAPFGVFGAIASVLAMIDFWQLITTYVYFFGSFLVGIGTLWIVLLLVGYLFLKGHMTTLLKRIVSPLVIAFGTTSSEAVFPKLTE